MATGTLPKPYKVKTELFTTSVPANGNFRPPVSGEKIISVKVKRSGSWGFVYYDPDYGYFINLYWQTSKISGESVSYYLTYIE